MAANNSANIKGQGVIYCDGSGVFTALAGSSGQVLQSGGASTAAYSTATYPSTSGTSGKIFRSNGTNFVNTTATYPTTTTVNQILYSSSANVIGGITTANNSILSSSGLGVVSFGTSLSGSYTFTTATASTPRSLTVSNTDNTSGTSNASIVMATGGTSSGDAYIRYTTLSSNSYVLGIDNSATQVFLLIYGANATATPSSGTTLQRFTKAGYMTLPLNACASADLNTGLTNATGDGTAVNPVIFDTKTGNFFDQNVNYSTGTGLFTVPLTGKYLVNAIVTLNSIGAGHTTGIIQINKNGSAFAINEFNPATSRNAANEFTSTITTIISASATDTISITTNVSGSTKTVGVKGNSFGSFTSLSINLIS